MSPNDPSRRRRRISVYNIRAGAGFGMALGRASARESAEAARWRDIRNIISADATLLSAVSRSDLHIHQAETEAAPAHLAHLVERTGLFLTAA